MLSIQRKLEESIHIFPSDNLDPNMTVVELFKDGAISVKVIDLENGKVMLGFNAPDSFEIEREELLGQGTGYAS